MGRQNSIKKGPDVREAADEALLAGKTLAGTAAAIKEKTGKDINKNAVARYKKQEASWLEAKRLNDKLIAALSSDGEADGISGALTLITTATLNLFRKIGTESMAVADVEKLARTLLAVQKSEELVVKRDERAAAKALAAAKDETRAAMKKNGSKKELIDAIIAQVYGNNV